MPAQPSNTESALNTLVCAAQEHLSSFIQTLPLRDADIADMQRALLGAPGTVGKLAQLQDDYLHQWIALFRDGERAQEPQAEDRRFSSPQWEELAWFRLVRRLYELNSGFISELAELPDLAAGTKRRLKFFSQQLVDAISPANFPATNPEAIARAFATRGESLTQGARAFTSDLTRGRISMSDESRFELGRNLAVTPGEIVYENDLIQLIQYRAQTKQVRARPLLVVPPFINKYYILDLQSHNSFVRYCVEQGITTFIISWRNIPESLGHLTWDDYIASGIFDAIATVQDICGAEAINALGYCVGGTLLASALAVKSRHSEHPVHALTLLASMLDFSDTGEISAYVDEHYVASCERQYAKGGVVSGSQLTNAFASLRANELVWHYVVNNYLLGKPPKAFDLLHWNADSANLPGPLYAYYLRHMYLENRLKTPGALRMHGSDIDLGQIGAATMIVAARDDHIVPWQTAYRSARLLGGDIRFVLAASGHVAGIVSPAGNSRRHYWSAGETALPADPEKWLAGTRQSSGSWWPHWVHWLQSMSGERVPAPVSAGNEQHRPIEAAPGRYVRERPDIHV